MAETPTIRNGAQAGEKVRKHPVLNYKSFLFSPLKLWETTIEKNRVIEWNGQDTVAVRSDFWRRPSRSTIGTLVASVLGTGVSI